MAKRSKIAGPRQLLDVGVRLACGKPDPARPVSDVEMLLSLVSRLNRALPDAALAVSRLSRTNFDLSVLAAAERRAAILAALKNELSKDRRRGALRSFRVIRQTPRRSSPSVLRPARCEHAVLSACARFAAERPDFRRFSRWMASALVALGLRLFCRNKRGRERQLRLLLGSRVRSLAAAAAGGAELRSARGTMGQIMRSVYWNRPVVKEGPFLEWDYESVLAEASAGLREAARSGGTARLPRELLLRRAFRPLFRLLLTGREGRFVLKLALNELERPFRLDGRRYPPWVDLRLHGVPRERSEEAVLSKPFRRLLKALSAHPTLRFVNMARMRDGVYMICSKKKRLPFRSASRALTRLVESQPWPAWMRAWHAAPYRGKFANQLGGAGGVPLVEEFFASISFLQIKLLEESRRSRVRFLHQWLFCIVAAQIIMERAGVSPDRILRLIPWWRDGHLIARYMRRNSRAAVAAESRRAEQAFVPHLARLFENGGLKRGRLATVFPARLARILLWFDARIAPAGRELARRPLCSAVDGDESDKRAALALEFFVHKLFAAVIADNSKEAVAHFIWERVLEKQLGRAPARGAAPRSRIRT